MPKTFAKIYKQVPAEQKKKFQEFRENHPLKSDKHNNIEWEYIECGRGNQTLVLLPGGARYADVWFKTILNLENEFRLIVPTIPPIPIFEEIIDGIEYILKIEKVGQVSMLGTSLGGCIAQCFVRKYPERINKVIFSHTTIPNHIRTKIYHLSIKIARYYPLSFLKISGRINIMQLMKPPKLDRNFWKAYWYEKYSQVKTKSEVINPILAIIDYAENNTFQPDDLNDFVGKILILESDNDPAFKRPAREALKQMYPQAKVNTFIGAGHTPGYTQSDEYIHVLREFLKLNSG
jgi:pimeloyl-ACP methyl ester carboxylesterase